MRKRLSKKFGVLCGISLCAMMFFATGSMEVCAAEDDTTVETDGTQATNLEWIYKYIDGVEYMRLYNHTTGEWLTDWIPAVHP